MKYFILLLFFCLMSCAIINKNVENGFVVRYLTDDDIKVLYSKGEVYKSVEDVSPDIYRYAKGTYRVIRTSKSDAFNIFPIGKSIEEWENGSNGKYLGCKVRDTIVYDSLGNIRSRLVYQETKKGSGVFRLYNRITSKVENGEILQTFNVINDRNIVVSEWVWKSFDQNVPGDGIRKKKIKTGKQTNYYPDGKLAAILYFDDKGKIVKKEKFQRE